MEAVIFIGLQASGKSSFYKERFFSTHVWINLDLPMKDKYGQFVRSLISQSQSEGV